MLAPRNPPVPLGSLHGVSAEDEDELDHDAKLVSPPYSSYNVYIIGLGRTTCSWIV